jgi:hypothetical protein
MCGTALQSPRSHRVTAPDEGTQPAAGNSKTHLLKCWCSRLICTLPLWRKSHCGIELRVVAVSVLQCVLHAASMCITHNSA